MADGVITLAGVPSITYAIDKTAIGADSWVSSTPPCQNWTRCGRRRNDAGLERTGGSEE